MQLIQQLESDTMHSKLIPSQLVAASCVQVFSTSALRHCWPGDRAAGRSTTASLIAATMQAQQRRIPQLRARPQASAPTMRPHRGLFVPSLPSARSLPPLRRAQAQQV